MSASSTHNNHPRKRRRKKCLFVKERQHAMLDKYQLEALVDDYSTQVKEFILFENACYGKIVFKTNSAAKIAVQKLQGHRKFAVHYWRESDALENEIQATSNPSESELIGIKCKSTSSEAIEEKCIPSEPTTTLVEPKVSFSSRQVEAPASKLVEVNIVEESLPCSKELMMYILNDFMKNRSTSLWRKILPVKVNHRNGVFYVTGVAEDVKTAIGVILGHPLLVGLNLELVYTKVDPRRIQKKVSMGFLQTDVIYDASNQDAVLLCSYDLSKLTKTKKLIEVSNYDIVMLHNTFYYAQLPRISLGISKELPHTVHILQLYLEK